ncbi:hypothetical protein [Bordetella genomosp. 5]|uniref:Uncharacterized protein n=1 Tax=Bordetella genomosp. 5 TaxID=1395608 RepID=A0A261U2D6_9BORD|nr:hypothetical protein [Bordetella genomosp. 5]OZI55582.1 hypothetical protein CAL25_04105 [Bordetella genomosp. 5]
MQNEHPGAQEQSDRIAQQPQETAGRGEAGADRLVQALQASRSVAIGLRSLLSILQEDLSRSFYAPEPGRPLDVARADALFELAGVSLDLLNDKLEHVADSLAASAGRLSADPQQPQESI